MFLLINLFILNIITLSYSCKFNNTLNLPKSTFRILNNCNNLFILNKFKWKDFNYINDFKKNDGVIFRYEKSVDATLFEANYDTFPIGDSSDGIFYDISVIPPDCGANWNKCNGNKLGYNVPLSVDIISDLKNKGGSCSNLICDRPQCEMGMKWPNNIINVYACPGSVSFIIKFGC